MSQALLIRADADARTGTGHVMRCLALAQCWLDYVGPVTLAASRLPDGLRDRLTSEGVAVRSVTENIADAVALAKELTAAVVVLDGYHFTGEDERVLHDAGFPVLAVDDYGHATHSHAKWVLNQNLGAAAATYAERGPHTTLLLGPRFAMLRKEFAAAPAHRRTCPERAADILVTMGGADPDNVTADVLRALASSARDALRLRVIVGGSNPHAAALEALADESPHRVELVRHGADMPAEMARADLAVTAGGSTCWELAAFGVPMAVVTIADNQVEAARAMHAHGMAVSLGRMRDWDAGRLGKELSALGRDAGRRRRLSETAAALIDGRGAGRVVAALTEKQDVDSQRG